jgi:membrane protease YdiL (CAAX protease family)
VTPLVPSQTGSEPSGDGPRPGSLGSSQVYLLAWVFYLGLAIAGVVWIGVREKGISAELFVDPARWWLDLALGLGLARALALVWWLARAALRSARRVDELLAGVLGALSRSELLALALLSGFAEELFFRGALQGSWGPVWATLIFALLHGGPGREYRVWTIFAALAGAALAVLVVWRGNLGSAVVAHVAFNAAGLWRLARLARERGAASAASGVVERRSGEDG